MIDAPLILLPHNPEETAKQRLKWNTEILVSRNGVEQRRKLLTIPLERLTYHITLVNAEEEAALQGMLQNAVDLRVGVPRWQDVALVALPGALTGDSTITATADAGARFGAGPGVLWLEGGGYEEVDIVSAVGTLVTLAAPLANDWPAGTSLLPLLVGYAESRVDGETYGQLKGNVTLSVDSESDVAGITDGGESVTMVPASIAVNMEAGDAGPIAHLDVQAVLIMVFTAAGDRIPDPDITISAVGPNLRVYATGAPGIYNVKNFRTSGFGASDTFDVTSGTVTTTVTVGID